jgi:hypothetical protein
LNTLLTDLVPLTWDIDDAMDDYAYREACKEVFSKLSELIDYRGED